MKQTKSLHVLCRSQSPFPKGVVRIDKERGIYDSISWRVREDEIAGLIGKPICLHDAKAQPSYFGGEIIEIRREPIADNDGEVRAIVRFKASREAKGMHWPSTDNPNEYCRIDYE